MRVGDRSPWGRIEEVTRLSADVVIVSTPSHGGIHVSGASLAAIPARYRRFAEAWAPRGWFEEDCAALAVVVTFPDLFPTVSAGDLPGYRSMIEDYAGEVAS